MSKDLLFSLDDHVATITLNRPQKRNAFSDAMLEAWAEALEECRRNEAIRALVVTGAGKAFCSGGDLGQLQGWLDQPPTFQKAYLTEKVHRIPKALMEIDKPVIAAINGPATGAGMDMALMCDIRFASDKAILAESYIKIGLVPGDGGAYFLPRLVGPSKALELLWTGDSIGMDEALRLGLVNKVLPYDELMPFTYGFARRLAQTPQQALRLTKRAVYEGLRMDLPSALDLISSHMGLVAQTKEHKEAVMSFLNKDKGPTPSPEEPKEERE